ncbi:GNAT family N-acetyltransferase [Roseivirga sp.]|uniref:GNAT family N-acetyltransferase n=1 Tax=Roseivirga sp. TaxID=1964215 RepID=UPI003B8E66D4
MSKDLIIRPVELKDAEALCTLGRFTLHETFEAPNSKENLDTYLDKSFSLANVEAQFKSPPSEFYFATLHKETVGYLKLNTSDQGLEIESIYGIGSAQGKRVGKALYTFAHDIAKSKKSAWLWLGVWQENVKAIEFYKRKGMEIFDTRQFQLGSELQDDFLMRMRIV